MHRVLPTVIPIFLTVVSSGALPVAAAECPAPISLHLDGQSLQHVLSGLAAERQFHLESTVTLDQTLSGNFTGSVGKVLRELLRDQNAIIEETSIAGCPDQARVTRIWLLNSGEAATRIDPPTVDSAPPPQTMPANGYLKRGDDRPHRGRGQMSELEKEVVKESRRRLSKQQRDAMDERANRRGSDR